MGRRRRKYKEDINLMRLKLYKANQLLDVIEAALDMQYKPSYWNIRRLINKLKKIQRM